MQSVLFNDDLFREVVTHLTPDEVFNFPPLPSLVMIQGGQHLSMLLNLSLVCRAFTDRALDERWLRVENLRQLFHLLPTFGRTNDGIYVCSHSFQFTLPSSVFLHRRFMDQSWSPTGKHLRNMQSAFEYSATLRKMISILAFSKLSCTREDPLRSYHSSLTYSLWNAGKKCNF